MHLLRPRNQRWGNGYCKYRVSTIGVQTFKNLPTERWGSAQLGSEAAGFGAADAFPILRSKAWPGAGARDLMLVGVPAGSVTYGRPCWFVLLIFYEKPVTAVVMRTKFSYVGRMRT